jgi:hypothetical protein
VVDFVCRNSSEVHKNTNASRFVIRAESIENSSIAYFSTHITNRSLNATTSRRNDASLPYEIVAILQKTAATSTDAIDDAPSNSIIRGSHPLRHKITTILQSLTLHGIVLSHAQPSRIGPSRTIYCDDFHYRE